MRTFFLALFCAALALAQAPKPTPIVNVSAATLGANTFTATQTLNVPSGNAGVVFQTGGVFKAMAAYISGSSSAYFGMDGGAILGINVLANGNVGIGTTTPGAPLDVAGTAYIRTQLYTNAISGYAANSVALGSGSGAFSFTMTSGQNLGITGGNVGIGTTTPAALLSVGASSQFQVSSTGIPTLNGFMVTPVVAKADATAQTASIGVTTLYAVPAGQGGMYRFSCYETLTQTATTSSVLPSCTGTFTDADSGVANVPFTPYQGSTNNSLLVGSATYNASSSIINAKPGTNITYATTGYASVGATQMQYAVHIKLEYLGQ